MEMPRTLDLLAWDMVPPPMDALHCFGLTEKNDIPLLVDSPGHIHGSVTGEVSTHFTYFINFSYKIGLGIVRFTFIIIFLGMLPNTFT